MYFFKRNYNILLNVKSGPFKFGPKVIIGGCGQRSEAWPEHIWLLISMNMRE